MGRLYRRDGKWGIDYVDGHGVRVRKVVARDESVARKLLVDAERAAERVAAGMCQADPREAKRPFADHQREYLNELHRLGRDAMYRYNVGKHIEGAAKRQRWTRLGDCTKATVAAQLRALHADGLHPRTVNAHLADLSAFFNWCVRTGRLEASPCSGIQKAAVKTEKTRRALSVAECKALLAAAPPERAIIYHFLILTGLRRAEAEAIRWGDVHLDGVNASIELPPSITKSGRPEAVPLVPALADALREHRGDAEDGDLAIGTVPSMWHFRKDLAAAKIDEVDARGRRVVVHCLRHSLATMLAVHGVPMAYAQRILRHRDIRLTAETYQDEAMLPLAGAMASLPALTAKRPAMKLPRTA